MDLPFKVPVWSFFSLQSRFVMIPFFKDRYNQYFYNNNGSHDYLCVEGVTCRDKAHRELSLYISPF